MRYQVRQATFVDSVSDGLVTLAISPPAWVPAGGSVEVDGRAVNVYDADDRLLVTYEVAEQEGIYRLD